MVCCNVYCLIVNVIGDAATVFVVVILLVDQKKWFVIYLQTCSICSFFAAIS